MGVELEHIVTDTTFAPWHSSIADIFGFGIRWKTGRGKAGELAVELGVVMAHLCVEGAPVRIDHPCRVRNPLAAVLDQAVNILVFSLAGHP